MQSSVVRKPKEDRVFGGYLKREGSEAGDLSQEKHARRTSEFLRIGDGWGFVYRGSFWHPDGSKRTLDGMFGRAGLGIWEGENC